MTAITNLLNEQPQLFTGRHWVFERIQNWMLAPNPQRYFLLKGDPGSGKSAIARRLTQSAQGLLPPPKDSQGAELAGLTSGCLSAEHFCSARDSSSFDPRNFAHSLAGQLAGRYTQYALALKNVGDIRIDIQGHASVSGDAIGATTAGVIIQTLNLNLAGLKPQEAFNRTVRDPLTSLYQQGFATPITILVDALDEALLYRDDVTIVDLLARLESLPAPVRFLLTSRRESSILSEFSQAEMLDISDSQFNKDNQNDIADFVYQRFETSPVLKAMLTGWTPERQSELQQTMITRAEGNFLYVRFLLDSLEKGQRTLDALGDLPAGLDSLYHDSLSRVVKQPGKEWRTDYAPLMGVLSVAQESLTRPQLQKFTQQTETQLWDSIGDLEPFLEVLPSETNAGDDAERYRLYHQSFIDFLRRPFLNEGKSLRNAYFLPAGEWHGRIADRYFQEGNDAWKKWDDYGLRAIATHLSQAAQTSSEEVGYLQTERLVRLLSNPRFQDRHLERLHELPLLQRDLMQAVRVSAMTNGEKNCVLTTEAAIAATSFLRERLKPEQIFAFARNGELEEAERELGLYAIEPEWRQAALLMIAWLTVESQKTPGTPSPQSQEKIQTARRLRDRLQIDLLDSEPLPLLLAQLNAALDAAPLPAWSLPVPPDEGQVRQMIERIGGNTPHNESLLVSGLQPRIQFSTLGAEPLSEACLPPASNSCLPDNWTPDVLPPGIRRSVLQTDSGLTYVAEQDGLPLVAYVAADRPNGASYFQEYVRIHASNGYIRYRNRSLGFLLEASLCHPNPLWAQEVGCGLITVALAGGEPEFQEGLQIILLARKACAGDHSARQTLDTLCEATQQEAAQLNAERELGDAWGHYKRRLAALAQAYFLFNESNRVFDLLMQAQHIPYGFAGFQTTASLALVEAMQICRFDRSLFGSVLESARSAAHNIQDATFCAQMTARVNAMIERWWVGHPINFDVTEVIPRFCENTAAPEFAPLHIVNDSYEYRSENPTTVPLPPLLRQANTLRQLAEIYRRPLVDFQRLNEGSGWLPDTLLSPGMPVCVPDVDFAPRLAARFAAQVLSTPHLSRDIQVGLIQSLVPVATGNAAFANTVLSRLFMAAPLDDPALLDPLLELAKSMGENPAQTTVMIPSFHNGMFG